MSYKMFQANLHLQLMSWRHYYCQLQVQDNLLTVPTNYSHWSQSVNIYQYMHHQYAIIVQQYFLSTLQRK